MKMTVQVVEGVVLARVEDSQVGTESADEFKSKIMEQLPAEKPRVGIDLTQVDFMDSSGLGTLVSLLKSVRPGGELVLFGLQPSVREILRLTHLDAVFHCEADQAAARVALEISPQTQES